jgi:hypothetical protein
MMGKILSVKNGAGQWLTLNSSPEQRKGEWDASSGSVRILLWVLRWEYEWMGGVTVALVFFVRSVWAERLFGGANHRIRFGRLREHGTS